MVMMAADLYWAHMEAQGNRDIAMRFEMLDAKLRTKYQEGAVQATEQGWTRQTAVEVLEGRRKTEDTRSPGQKRYESAAVGASPEDMRGPGLFESTAERVPWGKLQEWEQQSWEQSALPTDGAIRVTLDQWYEDREDPFRLLLERNLREIRDGYGWKVVDREGAMRRMFAVAERLATGV